MYRGIVATPLCFFLIIKCLSIHFILLSTLSFFKLVVLVLGVLQRSGGGGGPGSLRPVSVHDEEDTEEIKYLRKPVSKLMCAECVLSSLYCVHTTTA